MSKLISKKVSKQVSKKELRVFMTKKCKHTLVKRERFLSQNAKNTFWVVIWYCPKCKTYLETKEFGKISGVNGE